MVLGGALLQYVWRVQEMFPQLRFVQYTMLVSLGAVGLFVLDSGATRRVMRLRHDLYKLILGIFALAVLTVPGSIRPGGSFAFLTGNFSKTVILVGILAASIRDRRDVDRLLRVFVLGGAGYIIAAIAFAKPTDERLGGGSYDPNDLGLFTVSTLPLCVYFMRRGAPTRDRLIGLFAGAVLMVATVMSGSRGGFLALVAAAEIGRASCRERV